MIVVENSMIVINSLFAFCLSKQRVKHFQYRKAPKARKTRLSRGKPNLADDVASETGAGAGETACAIAVTMDSNSTRAVATTRRVTIFCPLAISSFFALTKIICQREKHPRERRIRSSK